MVLNAYVLFGRGAGGAEFFRRYGYKPRISLEKDNRLLGDLYQEISEEDRSYYKALSKSQQPQRNIVFRNACSFADHAEFGRAENKPRRNQQRRGGEITASSNEHSEAEWFPYSFGQRHRRPGHLPVPTNSPTGRDSTLGRNAAQAGPSRLFNGNSGSIGAGNSHAGDRPYGNEHGQITTAMTRHKPSVRPTAGVNQPANMFAGRFSVDQFQFQFISIYNYVFQRNANNTKTVYPAEIAVISFSMKKGVFEKDVLRVNFPLNDENDRLIHQSDREFFNGFPNEQIEEPLHRSYAATKSRAGYVKNIGCSFKEALLWLCEKFKRPGRINVIDKQSETLQTVYHMYEVNGSFSQKKQANALRFYSFDDLISMIMDSPCPKAVATANIFNYFTTKHTYNQAQIFCRDHKNPDKTVDGFSACPVFCALSKIQMFFDFCDDVGVCNFSRRNCENPQNFVFFQEHRMPTASNSTNILQLDNAATLHPDYDDYVAEKLRFSVMDDDQWDDLLSLEEFSMI